MSIESDYTAVRGGGGEKQRHNSLELRAVTEKYHSDIWGRRGDGTELFGTRKRDGALQGDVTNWSDNAKFGSEEGSPKYKVLTVK